MDDQLKYLKSVLEGQPDIEPWQEWFARNDHALQSLLTRTEYLHLKLERIKAIPEILKRFDIEYTKSDRYEWLGGKPGYCKDCGAKTESSGSFIWCPKGCFRMHVLARNK